MQLEFFDILEDVDYSDKKVMIGLSGGINSAAALVYLAKYVENKPKSLYLYYSHLEEHSPDTEKFCLELVEWARSYFHEIVYESSRNSMNDYCEFEFKGVPNPQITPCTKILKLNYMVDFMARHEIDLDIVGYVRGEYQRIKNQIDRGVEKKDYLIAHLSDEDCFSLVSKHFGWYPEIYSLKWKDKRIGEALKKYGHELNDTQRGIIQKYHTQGFNNMSNSYRVFKHNNCLPCKNMHQWELFIVRIFFPDYYKRAMDMAKRTESYWGRSSEIVDEDSDCTICLI